MRYRRWQRYFLTALVRMLFTRFFGLGTQCDPSLYTLSQRRNIYLASTLCTLKFLEIPRHFLTFLEILLNSLTFLDISWNIFKFLEIRWPPFTFIEIPLNFQIFLWNCFKFLEIPWQPFTFLTFPWNSLTFLKILLYSLKFLDNP